MQICVFNIYHSMICAFIPGVPFLVFLLYVLKALTGKPKAELHYARCCGNRWETSFAFWTLGNVGRWVQVSPSFGNTEVFDGPVGTWELSLERWLLAVEAARTLLPVSSCTTSILSRVRTSMGGSSRHWGSIECVQTAPKCCVWKSA